MDLQTPTASRIAAAGTSRTLRTGYLLLTDEPSAGDLEAMSWLENSPDDVLCVPVKPASLTIAEAEVLWIHVADEHAWTRWSPEPEMLAALREYVERGGKLLLTNFAALLPHAMGVEPCKPDVRTAEIQDKGFGRGCGFQSYRGNSVLKPFFGGINVWYPDRDCTISRIGYFEDAWPQSGRVVGVEKSYITLDPDTKLLIEHAAGDGRMLSAGAYIHFGEKNHLAEHARRFIRYALRYLAVHLEKKVDIYWMADKCVPAPFDVTSEPLGRTAPYTELAHSRSELRLHRDVATNNYVEVAGLRCLVMGQEKGGIDEVWVHPFRILYGLEVGFIQHERVRWLSDVPAEIDILPESIVRTYALPSGTLRETIWSDYQKPGGVIAFEAAETGPLRIIIRLRADFRWLWPYRENALGSLRYGYDEALHAVHVHNRSSDFRALYGADRPPAAQLVGPYERIEYVDGRLHGLASDRDDRHDLALAYLFDLGGDEACRLHFAFTGTTSDLADAEAEIFDEAEAEAGAEDEAEDEAVDEAEKTFRMLLSDPGGSYRDVSRHYEHLLSTSTMVTTPDPIFNDGYRWALVGTDRFWATTPGIGTGLMAGYGTTVRGWHGGHAVSGRPGYAWYFGRDAQWASFAVDGYGDFDHVKEQLEVFRRFQNFEGKIFHEVPTSGPVHYDAADSTPLFVILAAHYLRASGDVESARELWPSLHLAIEFLYSTDTDGDGLIENTHVGHGWIEGGELYGAHTTLYLAGTWAKALQDAAYIARTLGEADSAERYAADADVVVNRIETDFWDPDSGFYAYGKLCDGTFNPEQTILPAVLMYFRLLRPDRLGAMLRAFAGTDYTTDWGVRILSARSAHFSPQGYHYGSVWPLFTGWTALAEYAAGRSTQAFTHVMNNVLGYRHWSLGFLEEVLNGVTYEPAGVCAHQCWSQTNVLHPVYEGMIGFFPDAPQRRIRLEPRIPAEWNTFRADNLWAGASRIRLEVERAPGRTSYRLILQEGPPVAIGFAPELPNGSSLQDVQVDSVSIERRGRGRTGLLEKPISISLQDSTVVTLHHEGGLQVLPIIPHPEPGDASVHPRILDTSLEGGVYTIELEGCAGSERDLRVRLFCQEVGRIEGASVRDDIDRDELRLRTSFEGEADGYIHKTIHIHLA